MFYSNTATCMSILLSSEGKDICIPEFHTSQSLPGVNVIKCVKPDNTQCENKQAFTALLWMKQKIWTSFTVLCYRDNV